MLFMLADFAKTVVVSFWDNLTQMSPYLLFGFLMAGFLSIMIPTRLVEKYLGGRGLRQTFNAALFGVPLAVCSCGVLPVAASLWRKGAGRGATTAFLISTPQTGIDSILPTYSLLGPIFAVFRPFAALFSGLLGGTLVTFFEGKNPPESKNSLASNASAVEESASGHWWTRAFLHAFVTLPRDIGKSLLLGLVIAGLISAFVPANFFEQVPGGGNGLGAMLLMLILGIPLYVCATASVPVAATLIAKGISPGAAMVFLMTGPATNAATITTVWKMMGKRTGLIYLFSVAASAILSGVTLDLIIREAKVGNLIHHHHPESSGIFAVGWAVLLLGVLGFSFLRHPKLRKELVMQPSPAKKLMLKVTGMSCQHCAGSVRLTLGQYEGVNSVEVDLESGQVAVIGTRLDPILLCRAVRDLGYEATPLEPKP